jgi:hypothetical protein
MGQRRIRMTARCIVVAVSFLIGFLPGDCQELQSKGTLIHTCQLAEINSFDYLCELQKHRRELSRKPQQWMPWNYREVVR